MKPLFLILTVLFLAGCQSSVNPETGDHAPSSLTELEARAIAETSCVKGGEALEPGTYNADTKTWWFKANLNATRPGCSPACVVSEESKTAEINWRCTGALFEEEDEGTENEMDQSLTKVKKDDRYVYYDGEVTLSGKYRKTGPENLLGEILCFIPDEAGAALIPREPEDSRQAWFCFEDQSGAKALFEIEDEIFKDNPSGCIEGKATVRVSNYVTDLLESEVFDQAKLEKIISKEPYTPCK